ncbi:MAG: OFA family MFS transporter [Syntrophomonadaceae bacterium]|nr:OFA family MFS transporter [Syntrophomonadaceae bacterium]
MFVVKNIGWRVTIAAVLLNLASGFIYAWSVYAAALIQELGFTKTQAMLPYTVALAMLAVMMVPGGKLFDKYGPRVVATAGGILLIAGMALTSIQTTIPGFVFFFGVMVGAGSGIAYGVTIPSAVKWFPPAKRGLVSGLVVAGLGLAAAYAAPLAQAIINAVGVKQTFLIVGIVFGGLVVLLAQFLTVPPAGYVPPGTPEPAVSTEAAANDFSPGAMMGTIQFWLIWSMYCFGAIAGLMVIGHIAIIASIQAKLTWGFALVAILAVFNSAGRVVGGFLSDRIGRNRTLILMFLLQAANMLLFKNYADMTSLTIGVCITGIAYGALLGIFPALTYDYFGLKNSGTNYGLVFTAFGAAGVIGPLMAGKIVDITGSYSYAYLAAAIILAAAAVMAKFLNKPAREAMA